MEIRPVRTEADYKAALAAVAPYFDLEPEPGSEEGDRFELLLMFSSLCRGKVFKILCEGKIACAEKPIYLVIAVVTHVLP